MMQYLAIAKKHTWCTFLKAICLCFIGCFFIFSSSGAWATLPSDLEATVSDPGDSVSIGKTKLIPVLVHQKPAWKAASIRLEVDTRFIQESVNPAAVQTEEVQIDTTLSAPFTVYVPVKVNGEGLFTMKGVLHFQMIDGKKTMSGQSSEDFPLFGPGIFSFDGEVFFGNHIGAAFDKKADRNLRLEKPEISELLKKEQGINEGVFDKKTLSREEEEKLRQARTMEVDRLYKLYHGRYPIKPEPKLKAFSQPLKQGDSVTLEVNWPIDSNYTSFLPLDGAPITLTDNQDNSSLPAGTLINGKYTFIVPRDGYSFTARVTTDFGGVFSVNDGTNGNKGSVIEIGFQDTDVFNIRPFPNAAPPLRILDYEANAWSVFQAMVDLHASASNDLGVSKQGGYTVFVNSVGSDFNWGTGNIRLFPRHSFEWDVIAHELAHAIAYETNSTDPDPSGGPHSGNNQYDYDNVDPALKNPWTIKNKERSISLAFNEGFATWMGVSLLENSGYKDKMPRVGDQTLQIDSFSYPLEPNTGIGYYGEDAEFTLASLLWDLVDATPDEVNVRAKCRKDCRDLVSISLRNLYQNTFKGKNNRNISEYYRNLYRYYSGFSVGDIEVVGRSGIGNALGKTHELGVIFAEFGVAPNIDEVDNEEVFANFYKPGKTPPTITWKQLKTGTMPGLDEFEILFFSQEKDRLLHKLVLPNRLAAQNGQYQYTLSTTEFTALQDTLKVIQPTKLHVLIKGTASGSGVSSGAIVTGPYYSNLAVFEIGDKLAVIAVDSSGSNFETDPSNLRIFAAHKMLNNMAIKNKEILEGTVVMAEKPTSVAAIGFDSYPYLLADFSSPADLYQRQIFNAIGSWGGTDIAAAIHASTNLLARDGSPSETFPNQKKMYVLTDMDNNAGIAPVILAITSAGSQGIAVNIGHLIPLSTKSSIIAAEVAGDPANLLKAWEPFDAVIEAILGTGGSYAVIEDSASQDAWVDLMDYLNSVDPAAVTEIELPLNVMLYRLAEAGREAPTYIFRPTQTMEITAIMDGKNSFVPNLKVNNSGAQTDIGNDRHEIKFTAIAGQTYRITLGKDLASSGLYSIVLRGIVPMNLSSVAIPALDQRSLALLIGFFFLVAVGAIYRRRNGMSR
jgi:hypothetical protein